MAATSTRKALASALGGTPTSSRRVQTASSQSGADESSVHGSGDGAMVPARDRHVEGEAVGVAEHGGGLAVFGRDLEGDHPVPVGGGEELKDGGLELGVLENRRGGVGAALVAPGPFYSLVAGKSGSEPFGGVDETTRHSFGLSSSCSRRNASTTLFGNPS